MPNFITNTARRVTSFLRGGQSKAATIFMWPTWREGVPLWHVIDYSGYVNEGFNLNSLIYSAIMYKVRAMTAAPLRAWTGDVDTPERLPADNPLQQLVARPNPHQSQTEMHGQNVVYLNVAGNAYIWIDRGDREDRYTSSAGEGLPTAMYSLRPDRVFIVPGKIEGISTIVGYMYVPEGRSAYLRMSTVDRRKAEDDGRAFPIRREDIMHVKLPNPLDPLEGMGYGLSPLSAAARNTDVDNSVTHFLQLFFRQGVMLPGVLSTDTRLDDKTLARIKRQWKEMYGGYQQWAEEIGVLEAGTEYQRIGLTFQEMGFETLDDRNESRIMGPFGVAPILTGTRLGLNRSTYANYKEARQAFWEDTMVPETLLFETDFRYYLSVPDQEWFVGYDYSRVPAFQEIRNQQRAQFAQAWETGAATRNEYRRKLNLSPVEDGDVYRTQPTTIFIPMSMAPQAAGDSVTDEGSPEAEDDTRKALRSLEKKKTR